MEEANYFEDKTFTPIILCKKQENLEFDSYLKFYRESCIFAGIQGVPKIKGQNVFTYPG